MSLMGQTTVVSSCQLCFVHPKQFQRNQVNKFCDKYNLSTTLSLPAYRHHAVYRHLLINNDAETLFCFVPKVITILKNL